METTFHFTFAFSKVLWRMIKANMHLWDSTSIFPILFQPSTSLSILNQQCLLNKLFLEVKWLAVLLIYKDKWKLCKRKLDLNWVKNMQKKILYNNKRLISIKVRDQFSDNFSLVQVLGKRKQKETYNVILMVSNTVLLKEK